MEQDKSFKDSIVENTNADGIINWDKVEIPVPDITDWRDITDVPPHTDDALLARFGDNAAKVSRLLADYGPVNFCLRDLELLLTDATCAELKEISLRLDNGLDPQEIIALFNNVSAEHPNIKAMALVFTYNQAKHPLTLHHLIELEELLSQCYWGVHYNDTLPIDTLNITMIITQ